MERRYFLGGNTPYGFKSFYGEIVDNYNQSKLFILKGGSGTGKSTFIKKFAARILEKNPGSDVDYVHCSQEPTSLDGAIFPGLGVGIIDGTAPHITDPKYPGAVEVIIDLSKHICGEKILAHRSELQRIMAKKSEHYKRAYKELEKAKSYHDMIEKIYTPSVDFDGVSQTLDEVLASMTR